MSQKWYGDDGEVRWLDTIDRQPEPEPVQEPPAEAQPTQDTGQLIIPASFDRTAAAEDVPDAEKLPPPYRNQTAWHNAAPISPVQGLRAFAAVLRRAMSLDEDDR
jgi:hypothetical protein